MCRFHSWFGASALVGFLCVWGQFAVDNGMVVLGHGTINTTYGPVKGKDIFLGPNQKAVLQFLGIPYANASRFEPPQPPKTWNETLQVKEFGKSCPQPLNTPPLNLKSGNTSEYCLNLNVFVPNTTDFQNRSASFPVMFWVHGGAFMMGTSAFMTDATTMATEGEIIVVTINHRLGALGFLSTGEDGLKGNYGVLDVIEGLKWVKHNIESFGGDPGNITLAGWSAGARLVGMLMTSPKADGLYRRVIMMSGAAGGLFSYLEQKEAKNRAEYFGGLLRCPYPSSDFRDCLKRKSIKEIVNAQGKMKPSSLLAQWAPVVDGDLIPDTPTKLLSEGKFSNSSVLMGVANSDGSAYLGDIPGTNTGEVVSKGLNRAAFKLAISRKTWIRHQDDKVPNMIVYQYSDWRTPDDGNITRKLYLDLLTDSIYRAPAVESANAFAKKNLPVYFYQSEHRESTDPSGKAYPFWIGVPHRGELRYLFPTPNVAPISGFPKTMMDNWINYIKTGDPNIPGQYLWPLYTLQDQKYLALRPFPITNSKLRVEKMVFWNDFLPANGRREEKPEPTPPPDKNMDAVTVALIIVSCLFGAILVIVIVLIILLLRGGKSNPPSSPPPARPYSVSSQKPILYSKQKRYPTEEKSYHRYPDSTDGYPSNNYNDNYNDHDDVKINPKVDMDTRKYMDSDML